MLTIPPTLFLSLSRLSLSLSLVLKERLARLSTADKGCKGGSKRGEGVAGVGRFSLIDLISSAVLSFRFDVRSDLAAIVRKLVESLPNWNQTVIPIGFWCRHHGKCECMCVCVFVCFVCVQLKLHRLPHYFGKHKTKLKSVTCNTGF